MIGRALALGLLLVAATAGAATLEPAAPRLGERALLRLESAPADSTDWPVGLNAAIRATSDPAVFEFVPLRVGTVGAILPATGDTLRFEVPVTIEEARPEMLRPIVSVGDLGPDWTATVAIALLAVALLGSAIFWWLRRRRSLAPVVAPPPEPAEVVAMRELDRLQAERLVEAGRFTEFFVRGSHILREYAGRRFSIPVLDFTTTETLDSMREVPRAARHVPAITPLLNAADEVKFARHEPAPEDGAWWLGEARRFVEATTSRPEPQESGGSSPGDGEVSEVPA